MGGNLVLITGAAGGFGRAIRRAVRDWLGPTQVDWVLFSREQGHASDQKVTWVQVPDFADDPVEVERRVASSLASRHRRRYTAAFLFNNAGQLGTHGASDVHSMQRDFLANCAVSARIATCFAAWQGQATTPSQAPPVPLLKTVVYTSTLGAVSPMAGWSAYCATKAAGEMAHRVLAAERPEMRWLSYAPGPLVGTAMTREVETRMGRTIGCVDPDISARALVRLLKSDGTWRSGACPHIDFFDVEEELQRGAAALGVTEE